MTLAPPGGKAPRPSAAILLAAVVLGVGLLAGAMAVYPGGTAMDRAVLGHSFWRNFLCDLLVSQGINGQPNDVGARLARGALGCFGVAMACFWWLLPRALEGRVGRGWLLGVGVPGTISVVGLVSVPLVDGPLHLVAVFASSIPGLVAAAVGFAACVRARAWPLAALGAATVTAAAIDSVLYARSYMTEPRVVVPALPAFQRLAMIALVAWMGATAANILRRPGEQRAD